MTELKITLENAKKAYQNSTAETKKTLDILFGGSINQSTKNWESIKSFEAACEVEGIDPVQFVKELSALSPDTIAYEKLKLIIRVINGGWIPDYSNKNQYKYFPYFNCKSGFGFSLTDALCTDSLTSLGSRLVLENEKKAIHMGTHFLAEYKSFFM